MDNIQRILLSSKHFIPFAGYILKITHLPQNYTSVSQFLNLFTLEFKRSILDIRFLNNFVLSKTDTSRLLEWVQFHVPKIKSRNKQMFEISIRRSIYLWIDPIQRIMRIINFYPKLKMNLRNGPHNVLLLT
jgi:hypothetical protein|uniref:Uncharacterized protein n=1 Tax=Sipha flava TaxID=143950 RepID=A0A2S2QQ96_9HEMI